MKHVASIVGKIVHQASVSAVEVKGDKMDIARMADWLEFDLRIGSVDQPKMEKIVETVSQFVRDMRDGKEPYWLSMLGTSGIGKTMMAKRVWRWHLKCGLFFAKTVDDKGGLKEIQYPRQWCFWPTLAGELHGNSGYGELNDLREAEFSIFDELGGERDKSGHVTDCLVRTLSARVGRWTMITSNRTLADVQREIDTRISSRMIRDGSVVLDIDSEDYAVWKQRTTKGKQ